MSYTNPNGWSTPRTTLGGPPSNPTDGNSGAVSGVDWISPDMPLDIDLKRIETNIAGLHTLLCQSGTVDVKITTAYYSSQIDATWKWQKINSQVFISIPEMLSPLNNTNTELQIAPKTTWPSEILPTTATLVLCLFQKDQNDTYTIRPGYMLIPTTNNVNIVCYTTKYSAINDTDGCLVPDDFSDGGGSGNNKSVPCQSINYFV
jgi:hypothetical protein